MIADLPLSEKDFDLFQKFLVSETGLCFDDDRDRSLQRALYERMQKTGGSSYQQYYDFLRNNDAELNELIVLITTVETYFFRNIAQYEVLKNDVLPEIIRKKQYLSDRSIKVWSAGSSKGDEAYSIAIAIMETLPEYKEWNIAILGTDINQDVLAAAREGVYGQKDIGELPAEYVAKYFEKKGPNFILSPLVKQLVRFERHNLVKGPFNLEGMRDLDIIFCRNVTIYFNLETTKRVINHFYDGLSINRFLFLGHSESLWQISNKFQPIEYPKTFIYKKRADAVEQKIAKPFFNVPVIGLQIKPRPAVAAPEKKAAFVKIEKPAQAVLPKKDTPVFAQAMVLSNQGKYEDAVSLLSGIIREDNLHTGAVFLLATLYYKTGRVPEAEELFRKAVYIDPDNALAYFNLASIYLTQEKFAKAELELKNSIKVLEKEDKDKPIKFCEDLTAGILLQTCKRHLGSLRNGGG